jgi:hypothetical protein
MLPANFLLQTGYYKGQYCSERPDTMGTLFLCPNGNAPTFGYTDIILNSFRIALADYITTRYWMK